MGFFDDDEGADPMKKTKKIEPKTESVFTEPKDLSEPALAKLMLSVSIYRQAAYLFMWEHKLTLAQLEDVTIDGSKKMKHTTDLKKAMESAGLPGKRSGTSRLFQWFGPKAVQADIDRVFPEDHDDGLVPDVKVEPDADGVTISAPVPEGSMFDAEPTRQKPVPVHSGDKTEVMAMPAAPVVDVLAQGTAIESTMPDSSDAVGTPVPTWPEDPNVWEKVKTSEFVDAELPAKMSAIEQVTTGEDAGDRAEVRVHALALVGAALRVLKAIDELGKPTVALAQEFCDTYMRVMGIWDREIETMQAQTQRSIHRRESMKQSVAYVFAGEFERLGRFLILEQIASGSKHKSMILPHGDLKLRKDPDSVEIEDLKAVFKWVLSQSNAIDFLALKESGHLRAKQLILEEVGPENAPTVFEIDERMVKQTAKTVKIPGVRVDVGQDSFKAKWGGS